jgi:hypothetical protein
LRQDNFEAIRHARPILPPNAYNRVGDNWHPLFAIAQVIGGDWPERILAAFNHLTSVAPPTAQEIPKLLLSDIRQIFTVSGANKMRSKELLAALWKMPNRNWARANKNNTPISDVWLGQQLAQFGITTHTLRFEGHNNKGYLLTDFADAFEKLR